ncbi:MAG TPA: FKBP-type peptidyl-prolyl cis-trans isomerase [Gemmatimonadaceae bacterium]|nr:FKBP-type peptidyl-prolyl cis-trans isomerase [Gemmatimonadaceae bacterium]
MRFHVLTTLFAAALAAGCSNNSPTAVPIEQTTFASSLGVNLAASTKQPSGLYYRDITVGTGTTLAAGQTVGMRYVGSFANGDVFDSNPEPKAIFSFRLGAGQVIKGWDLGLVGMKVGGRRQLIIPPELGYGTKDAGRIPGNSVLVFTVDAISAQ